MNIFTITLFTGQQNCLPLGYGAFALIPQGPAQQKPSKESNFKNYFGLEHQHGVMCKRYT
jgi:hypothetical protein